MNFVNNLKNWQKYRATYAELSRLGGRELADLGIERSEIGTLARKAAGY